MATKKKMLQAAAGNATGGAGLDITEVFSTYLYTGAGGTGVVVDNGIDLAGEGGLVWIKARNAAEDHVLFDTERGVTKLLESNTNLLEQTNSGTLTNFYSDGFRVDGNGTVGSSLDPYASWTFRKAPKFFDVVEWDGDGVAGRQIPHNLGSVPGAIFVKLSYMSGGFGRDWMVYHRGSHPTSPEDYRLHLNLTNSAYDESGDAEKAWNGTAPTDTHFTVGNDDRVNSNYNNFGWKYVAYVFAHNDGDGEFGPDGDQDIIKCGSFPWGSTSGTEVNLGFEPQWILFKAADQEGKNWFIFDAMRGIVTGGLSGDGDAALFPNTSGAENVNTWGVDLTPTGFIAYGNNIASSGNIIYMAIRRGPLTQPESGTEVFDVALGTGTYTHTTGFPVDLAIQASRASTIIHRPYDRLRGGGFYLETSDSTAEANGGTAEFDNNTGYTNYGAALNTVDFMWKRAPGFCDVVAYSGNSTAGRTVSHNLGVAPEMMWVKRRDAVDSWAVFLPSILGNTKALVLDQTLASFTYDGFNNTDPSDTAFTLSNDGSVNASGSTYIAYLFATVPGVSKVGSYTGNGTSQTIDCGFTSGARFVLIKETSGTGDWYVWDSERGITASSDPYLKLNTTDAESTTYDGVSTSPSSVGFSVEQVQYTVPINRTNNNYIFYAIA